MMKKMLLFLTLLASMSTVFGLDFSRDFFDTHLNARINRVDLATEFKDWAIVGKKPMALVFRETMTASMELKKMYYYFRGPVAKTYDVGIKTDCIQISHAVTCTKCNVDVIVDIFRKALIKRGLAFETSHNKHPKLNLYPTKENLKKYSKFQLDVKVTAPKTIPQLVKKKIEYQKPIINMKLNKKKDYGHTQVVIPRKPRTNEPETTINKEIKNIEVEINEPSQVNEPSNEESFSEKLSRCIKNFPNGIPSQQGFNQLTLMMLGATGRDVIPTKRIVKLDKEIDQYISERTRGAKPLSDYTWWERQLHKSSFKWAQRKITKKIQRQRVINKGDLHWIKVALNLKVAVTGEIIKRVKHKSKIKYIKARTKAIKFIIGLR